MSYDFELIRQAICAKADNVSAFRSANTDLEVVTPRPAFRVLMPTFEMIAQDNGLSERYALIFPFEVLVDRPAGKTRSSPTVISLMRLLQVEWQHQTSLPTAAYPGGIDFVQGTLIESMTPGLNEFADTELDGFSGSIRVKVDETLTSLRTTS